MNGIITKCQDGRFNFDMESTQEKYIYIDRMNYFLPGKIKISNERVVTIVPLVTGNSVIDQIVPKELKRQQGQKS